MRKILNEQMKLGEKDVSQIKINTKSRDDIPQILLGLQHLYQDKQVIGKIFEVLQQIIPASVDTKNGRPGMDLWKAFVLIMLRTGLNCDYDRLEELANNHATIREMLGHGIFDEGMYTARTIRNNFCLFTPEILAEINSIIVESGYQIIKKKVKTPVRVVTHSL